MTEANTARKPMQPERLVIMRVGALHRAMELMITEVIGAANDESISKVDAALIDIMSIATVMQLTIAEFLKDTGPQASPAG